MHAKTITKSIFWVSVWIGEKPVAMKIRPLNSIDVVFNCSSLYSVKKKFTQRKIDCKYWLQRKMQIPIACSIRFHRFIRWICYRHYHQLQCKPMSRDFSPLLLCLTTNRCILHIQVNNVILPWLYNDNLLLLRSNFIHINALWKHSKLIFITCGAKFGCDIKMLFGFNDWNMKKPKHIDIC